MTSIYYALGRKTAAVITQLKPHQQRVLDRMREQPGLVVAHGLGSGKTLSSIATADTLGMPTRVLVPASLQENYRKELEKHTDAPVKDLSVGSLQRAVLHGDTGSTPESLLVVDEAHRIRDPGTKGHRVLKSSPAAKRMFLTASPVYNHPSDIAALVNLAANDRLLPPSKADFEREYVEQKQIDPGFFARTFRGIKPGVKPTLIHKKRLGNILNSWVDYHQNPTDTGDFPLREDIVHEVPMAAKQQEVYDALLAKAPPWMQYKIRNGLPPSKQEAQLINSFLTTQRQVAGSIRPFVEGMTTEEATEHAAKTQAAFKNFLSEKAKNPRHKAVVYSNYLASGLEPYEELLKKNNIPYGLYTGKEKKAVREQMVRDYNEDKLPLLLVSSAGGEGLDLKGTRQIQIMDPHWNDEKIQQVIGRGIRYRSHHHLPEDERKVKVERYLATQHPSWWNRLVGSKPGDQTADQYLSMLSATKKRLNDQLRDVLGS